MEERTNLRHFNGLCQLDTEKRTAPHQFEIPLLTNGGREIIVTGTYAYEWSVIIKSRTSVTSMSFRTRIEAVKLINELKRRT